MNETKSEYLRRKDDDEKRTTTQREKDRKLIEEQTKEFLENGGKIKHLKAGESSIESFTPFKHLSEHLKKERD